MSRRLAPLAVLAALIVAGCGDVGEPSVGECVKSDPNLGVELDVEIVGCDDEGATLKIVKEAKTRAECESGTLTFEDRYFCTEPLKQ